MKPPSKAQAMAAAPPATKPPAPPAAPPPAPPPAPSKVPKKEVPGKRVKHRRLFGFSEVKCCIWFVICDFCFQVS